MALTKVNSQLISGGGGMTTDTTGNVTFSQAAIFSYSANANYATDGALSNYSSTNGVYLNGNAAGYLRLSNDGTGSTKIDLYGSSYGEPNIIKLITSGAERLRVDASGNILVGGTTAYALVNASSNTANAYNYSSNSVANQPDHFVFKSSGTTTGSIVRNGGTGTSYLTTSDYRLKENVSPMVNALETVSQLKPVIYTWKLDGTSGQGFIAHELQKVIPDAVSGEKDAVEEDGTIKPQGIDQSRIVATLTAAIQELKAEVDSLKAQLTK